MNKVITLKAILLIACLCLQAVCGPIYNTGSLAWAQEEYSYEATYNEIDDLILNRNMLR